MYYIIQENLFREYHYNTLVERLRRLGLEYETIPFRPFTDELEVKTDRKDVFLFGSVNASMIAQKYDWHPGSLYNDSHDFEAYGPKYGKNMLNCDGIVIEVGQEIPESFPYAFFARPTKDTKVFTGGPFTKDSWKEWIKDLSDSSMTQNLKNDTRILIAPLKSNIQQEIRCWIVDGKPVTISQYKIGSRVVYMNHDDNEEAMIFAKDMAKLFSPAKAFVLDICLFEDEYKVVEINCINCSGFYDGNMNKLIEALESTKF